MKRVKLSNKGSKKLYRATVDKVHKKNDARAPMRGGIRL